jgi:cytochrome c peroxidase
MKFSSASCHAPEAGFTGPDSATNLTTGVYEGAIVTRYGNRKPPSYSYVGDSPALQFDEVSGLWKGGYSGTGEPRGSCWGIRWRNRPKDPSSTRWKWLCQALNWW